MASAQGIRIEPRSGVFLGNTNSASFHLSVSMSTDEIMSDLVNSSNLAWHGLASYPGREPGTVLTYPQ